MRNWKSSSIRTVLFGLLPLAGVVFLLAGCGLKGNPIPSGLVLPPAVKNLEVNVMPDGNRLTCTIPEGQQEIASVRILRSVLDMDGGSCPGCPVEYTVIAELPVPGRAMETGAVRLEYVDRQVKPGRIYTYRIALCDASGFCGAESQRVEARDKGQNSPQGKTDEGATGTPGAPRQ